MDRIDFSKAGGFPLTQDTLDFMQDANIGSLEALAVALQTLCGSQYVILSGCAESGSKVLGGVVAIGGEIMPFVESTKSTYVVRVEEATKVVYKDGTTQDAYFKRYAKFGSGVGQIAWSEFVRISHLPTHLPNPHTLTIQVNGVTVGSYDGSANKTINIETAVEDTNGVNSGHLSSGAGYGYANNGIIGRL